MTHPLETPPLADRAEWQAEIARRNNIGEIALSNFAEPWGIKHIDDPMHAYEALTGLLYVGGDSSDDAVIAAQKIIDSVQARAFASYPKNFDTPPAVDEGELINIASLVINDPAIQKFIQNRDLSAPHARLLEVWPAFLDTFTRGTKMGVELGYIPAVVETRLESAFKHTVVRTADAAVLSTYGAMTAYYRNDKDEVGIRHDLEQSGEDIEVNLAHEFVHKLSGGTFRSPLPGATQYERPRVGYSTEIRPDVMTRTGLNEAVNHHITLGIMTGDFETFDPDARSDGDRTYYDYRKVVATFINASGGHIQVRSVTNGHYEDTGPGGSYDLRRRFVREALDTYGPGALVKLEKLCELSTIVDDKRLAEIVLSRIHPPEFDDAGRITKKGRIDTDNMPDFFDLYKTNHPAAA